GAAGRFTRRRRRMLAAVGRKGGLAVATRMNRKELDALAAQYRLTPEAMEAAFGLAGARPGPDELERFAARLLALAGVLSLAAGVVFFVAANWGALVVVGRFALLEG